MNALEKLKIKLAGWSARKFLGKYARRGIRVAVTFVLGHVGADQLVQWGVTIDQNVLILALETLIWTKLELLANIAKTKAADSEKWRWLLLLL